MNEIDFYEITLEQAIALLKKLENAAKVVDMYIKYDIRKHERYVVDLHVEFVKE